METINMEAMLVTLRNEIAHMATAQVKEYANEAKADGWKLLENLKSEIQSWSKLLAEGKIKPDDLQFLMMAQEELLKMNALKQAGLGKIKADEFKNSVLELVIKTVAGMK